MTETRKLAAILVSDIVGYSRLAGADEESVLARLRALRRELIDPKIALYKGRIVKSTGDGVIVEFRSAVDAVRAAIEVQTAMVDRNAGIPEDRQIVFRIGVHVGDVVEESDGDLMGDGVNIAARLEGVAAPGAICLSEDAYRQVKARLDLAVTDMGETKLKNIAEPVRAYALRVGKAAAPKLALPPEPGRLALPDKPSIAVLPFTNMSGDPEQDYFADGMVEDITTGLSRIKWLFVTARNSSFTYKGKAVDVRQVGRELGIRYVLEGGVRKAGDRLRINTQLIEAESGAHLWADKFDGGVADVFDLQDRITDKVIGIIEPSLRKSEIERSRRKRPDSLDAYDLYLHAAPYMASVMPADARKAAAYLKAALEIEPGYAAAHALLGWCHEICFTTEPGFVEAERLAGVEHARKVISSTTDDAGALAIAALVVAHLDRDLAAAANAIERALLHNASCATALYFGAHVHAFTGDVETARAYADRALRLSPFDPLVYEAYVARGLCAVFEGRYPEATVEFAKMTQANPAFSTLYFLQAMALALAGRSDDARPVVARGMVLEPTFRSGILRQVGLLPLIADRLAAGAHLLGLPE